MDLLLLLISTGAAVGAPGHCVVGRIAVCILIMFQSWLPSLAPSLWPQAFSKLVGINEGCKNTSTSLLMAAFGRPRLETLQALIPLAQTAQIFLRPGFSAASFQNVPGSSG
jgi:hypothetical protein